MMRAAALILGVALLAGCGRDDAAKPVPSATAEAKRAGKVEIVPAPADGEVQEIVYRELEHAHRQNRTLLVYVGATWCEPCQRFHDAAKLGQLDAAFPGLTLLEFDLDHDGDRLKRAGYQSKMIPLFAVPRADGTASGLQIEGSIKGDGAVAQISPRLKAMLAKVE
jgi:thiol-disulfide isomerase/thioredoxin